MCCNLPYTAEILRGKTFTVSEKSGYSWENFCSIADKQGDNLQEKFHS